MDIKDHILQTTFKLIFSYGITLVTMDFIAKECGISKRTLYEQFSDKNSLMICAIKMGGEAQHAKFGEIHKSSPNRMIAFLKIASVTRKYLANLSPVFFADMDRLYPQIANEFKEYKTKKINKLIEILEQGKEEGVVRKEINSKMVSFLFFTEMQNIRNNKEYNSTNFAWIDVYDAFFACFMRGIATPIGIGIIENYNENNEK